MKNDLVEARLRRDEALSSFLTAETANYAAIETDVAPLRQQLAAALAAAQNLAQDVLAADNDGATARKKGIRHQLTQLLRRLTVALHAQATSTKDNRLLALSGQVSNLKRLGETSFTEEARRLLSLAPERSAALSKRFFMPEHYQQAQSLLSELRRSLSESRLNDGEAATGRQGLERLIKQNARLIEQLRTYFRVYEQEDPALWSRFQSAARMVKRSNHVEK
ncbi:hypothetical protein GCM10027048_04520 [Hymenobacter coalescens]